MDERFECTTLAKKALYKYSSFPFPLISFYLFVLSLIFCYASIWCLQCFDTVGWAAGRTSGL